MRASNDPPATTGAKCTIAAVSLGNDQASGRPGRRRRYALVTCLFGSDLAGAQVSVQGGLSAPAQAPMINA
jgi:hypothetical protein